MALVTTRRGAIQEMFVLQQLRRKIEIDSHRRGIMTEAEKIKYDLLGQDLMIYQSQLRTVNGRSVLGTPVGERADLSDPPAADLELERL